MAKTETKEGSRVGVFVCHCGTNIGGVVDVTSVAEYAKTLPGVAFATDNLYTCAEDGLASIKAAIKEHDLDRVVVASCTPRTHAPLFQATVEEVGLNKYLFTFVNIREHCSWVHMKQKEAATNKAKDLIRMGVARAKLLTPQEEPKIPVERSALVVGGGPAGMTAALSIARQGFPEELLVVVCYGATLPCPLERLVIRVCPQFAPPVRGHGRCLACLQNEAVRIAQWTRPPSDQ